MLDLFRVFPCVTAASPDEPGGARFVPLQGGGRLDNPGAYFVLYLGDAESGALAEAFGRFPEWTSAMLKGSPTLPGSRRAIAHFQLPDDVPICNLGDPRQLIALELRPSDVVSRDYTRTRAWARRVFDERRWAGVRWWSYYDPRWSSVGLWNIRRLRLVDVRLLRLDDPALQHAARVISHRIASETPQTPRSV